MKNEVHRLFAEMSAPLRGRELIVAWAVLILLSVCLLVGAWTIGMLVVKSFVALFWASAVMPAWSMR